MNWIRNRWVIAAELCLCVYIVTALFYADWSFIPNLGIYREYTQNGIMADAEIVGYNYQTKSKPFIDQPYAAVYKFITSDGIEIEGESVVHGSMTTLRIAQVYYDKNNPSNFIDKSLIVRSIPSVLSGLLIAVLCLMFSVSGILLNNEEAKKTKRKMRR